MSDTQLWWYVSRASAIVAWALLTLTTLWGVLLATRVLRVVDNPAWLRSLHTHLSTMALVMTMMHVGSLLLDPYLRSKGFDIVAALVPFASSFEPVALGLGIVALYLLAAVALSSLAIRLLPHRVWKGIHYTSYAVVALVAFHAGLAGSDSGAWWYVSLSTTFIVLTAVAGIVRQIVGSAAAQRRRAAGRGRGTPARPATPMRVAQIRALAEGVRGIRLVPDPVAVLPPFTPGAYLTLHVPPVGERRYSLCGDPADRYGYEIAIHLSESSTGGSRYLHESLRVGQSLVVGPPRSTFSLEPAPEYLFVAGGIGITPIMAMIASLPASRRWELLYLGRSRSAMAFAAVLEDRYPGRVTVYARDEHAERMEVGQRAAAGSAEVYACGPPGLLDALTMAVPPARLHVERFVPVDRSAGTVAHPVQVDLPGVGTFRVPADRSILEVLEEAGVPIAGSCREGVCGACELRVCEGTPLHLDSVRSDAEKDAAGVMYPCVSRAVSERLVVDVVE